MTTVENESKRDSNHEFNVYADKQFQGQLLQVDEDSDIELYEIKLAKQGTNLKTSAKQSRQDNHADDIIGWFPGAKFSSRKQDSGNTKAETGKSTPFIHPWKDYRSTKKEDTFVFKHYADYRKYMEQYRNEHGCHNSRFTSGNPYGDSRRIAFQTTTPQLPSYTPQYQPNSAPVGSSPAGVIFANRREQLGTLVTPNTNNGQTCTCGAKQNNSEPSSQYTQKFKLAPGSFQRNNTSSDLRAQLDSDNSSESGEVRLRPASRRSNSATSTRCRSTSKTATKITVPANPNQRPYPMQALTMLHSNNM